MSKITDNSELLVPIWVLKQKVEDDWNAWYMLSKGISSDPDYMLDEDEIEEEDDEVLAFPQFDSTIKTLEILKNAGIIFDKKSGKWSND